MPKGKGKQRKRVRKRTWDPDLDADAVVREQRRVRGRESGVASPVQREQDFSGCFGEFEPNGLVVSPYGRSAFVWFDGEERLCRVAEELTDGKTSILAPGDAVRVDFVGAAATVTAVRRRRTRLSRPASRKGGEQVIAANIDLLVIVTSAAQPRFKPGIVDRYLIVAEVGGVGTLLCVNKMDLAPTEPKGVEDYRDLGVPVITTSCVDGRGLDQLQRALRDKVSILAGQSGVGKSSLLNAMYPALNIPTQTVSNATEKGRHSTTSFRLYQLQGGVQIIDTPGIKHLEILGLTRDHVEYYFPDIAKHAGACRFRNCTHTHEPNCAVRDAVESGAVSLRRYRSYLSVLENL